MNPVTFNCTVLRDGHQSLAATRMKTADMLPIAPILDSMGFSALETWGGATIDAGLRFLKEWPFDRLDALKKAAPKTPHMMLLRGQNIVGYTNYADDVVEAFVAMSAKHGMNIFRIFDCVNDPRNMETSIRRGAQLPGKNQHLSSQFPAEGSCRNFLDGTGLELMDFPQGINRRCALFRVTGIILQASTVLVFAPPGFQHVLNGVIAGP